jgi:glutamyl-tRNA synthetase
MDGTKMSKRDKAKMARKTLKDALAKEKKQAADLAPAIKVDAKELADFLAAENDSLPIAEAIASHYKVALPEIEVADFRDAGYAPEAINNFLALLGWNPGMKLADGKDVEKFDTAFLSQHFSIDRIGKTNSKFDRAKLLSFNADALGAMTDEHFARRWFAWCGANEPALAAKARQWDASSPASSQRWLWLAKAIKPRAKTFRDGVKACGFVLLDHVTIAADVAAKHLDASDGQGRALLREYRQRLAALSAFEPKPILDVIEELARDKGFPNPGPIAQAVRVAVAGVPVTPGIGETLAVLGRDEAFRRMDAASV